MEINIKNEIREVKEGDKGERTEEEKEKEKGSDRRAVGEGNQYCLESYTDVFLRFVEAFCYSNSNSRSNRRWRFKKKGKV